MPDNNIILPVCANCGKGEEESDKLKACTACKMVKYCNRECQLSHRPQHKRECRKRAAELHDEKLFKQPPPKEDCQICLIRMPSLLSGSKYMSCCGKTICSGCDYAPLYDNQGNEVDNEKCPFCRAPLPDSDEGIVERLNKRMEADDPIAIHNIGCDYQAGTCGFPQDYTKALELYHRAAELCHAESFSNIGNAYYYGRGVEVDKQKAKRYHELAAMGGDEIARHNLGLYEGRSGNLDRALKHYMIAVRDGQPKSLEEIQVLYSKGFATKEDYAKALRSYQAYLDVIKSDHRDRAAAFSDEYKYY